MGMDAIELVISFEDAFGIAIPDDVATQMTTPRKVTDYIMAQVVVSDEVSCLSQQAFHFLRKELGPRLNIARSKFAPNTRLETLIPLESRRRVWASLKSQMGPASIPDLARPRWLFFLLSLITALASVYALIQARHNFKVGSTFVFFFAVLVTVVIGYGGSVITRPFQRNFRRGCESAGDLAKYLSVHGPHVFKKEKRGWTRAQVAQVVREIIIDQVGVKDFTEDSHFVDDLHLD
jgi:acyl carrier protein